MNILLFADEMGFSGGTQLDTFLQNKLPSGTTVTTAAAVGRTSFTAVNEIESAVNGGIYDVCVILVGTNDSQQDNPKITAQNIRKAAKNAKNAGPGVVICTPVSERQSEVTAWLNRLNNNPAYKIVDVAAPFFEGGYADSSNQGPQGPIGFPTSEGNALIAEAIASAI